MRRIVTFLVVGVMLTACEGSEDAAGHRAPSGEPRDSDGQQASPKKSAAAEQLTADNQAFAFDLYRQLSSAYENVFLSPYSISMVVAMLYAGSKGTTDSEIAATLHCRLPQSKLHTELHATARELEHRNDVISSGADGAPRSGTDSGAADLSGIGGKPGELFVDEIYHKAFISVDEDGTEAAAATVAVGSADFQPRIDSAFDRPFMFVVFDDPRGRCCSPTSWSILGDRRKARRSLRS